MSHRLENMGQKKYEGLTSVNQRGDRHFNGVVRCVEEDLLIPLRWKKPRRCFVNSMADLFHRDVPFDFIDKVFAVMALCPQHIFQILTKRADRMEEWFREKGRIDPPQEDGNPFFETRHHVIGAMRLLGERNPAILDILKSLDGKYMAWPLPNVWIGTSTENQEQADNRIPHLLRCPAVVRFLSCEPLLGEIDLRKFLFSCCDACDGAGGYYPEWDPEGEEDCSRCDGSGVNENFPLEDLHWVIAGGESGPGARPCTIGHIRRIVQECSTAEVPVFVKQIGDKPVNREGEAHPAKATKGGDPAEWPEDIRVQLYPEVTTHA